MYRCVIFEGGRTESHVTDGDVVPVTPQGDDGGFSEAGGAALEDPVDIQAIEEAKTQMWMDFEVFCKCFKWVLDSHTVYRLNTICLH